MNYCPHIPIDELLPIFSKTDSHDFNANATNALKNTGVLLSYIIVATFFLLALIYFRLYKILIGFGIFLIIMLCTMKSLIFWHNLLFFLFSLLIYLALFVSTFWLLFFKIWQAKNKVDRFGSIFFFLWKIVEKKFKNHQDLVVCSVYILCS